ncbi:MAG: hypothetical protein WC979_04365 [Candidatus Pacearchaeota archaeon]|jgi:hypothetical protein
MVYKRYIKKNGKSFGPYYYSSHREGKKVVSRYVPEYEKKSNLFDIFALGLVFLFIFFMFSMSGINYHQYNQDVILAGNAIRDVSSIDIGSFYESVSPWILLVLAAAVMLFLGYSMENRKRKRRARRISEMSYAYGEEESKRLIQKLLHK